MNETEIYYTIEEVAKLFKVAYLTVYRWIQAGKIKAIKAGRQYRISKVSLNNFINNNSTNEEEEK